MTREEALEQLRIGPGINEDVSEEYNDAVNVAIEDVETMQEFENLHLITGGRLNGKAYAYKCGFEAGKRKALEQEPCEDCVSRKAVLNTLFYKSDNNCEVFLNKELQDRVKALPPVTPNECENDECDIVSAESER